MPDILIKWKKFNKGQVARRINIDRVSSEYVDGVVQGLKHAFDPDEYDIDLSDVEQARAMRQQSGR